MEKVMSENYMYKVCYQMDNFVVFKYFKTIDTALDFCKSKGYDVLEIKRYNDESNVYACE